MCTADNLCSLHISHHTVPSDFTDYDMLLEALLPRFFSVSYGMPLIS